MSSTELVPYQPPTPVSWSRWLRRALARTGGLLLGVVLPVLGLLALPAAPIVTAVLGVPALAVGILGACELVAYGWFVAWRAEH